MAEGSSSISREESSSPPSADSSSVSIGDDSDTEETISCTPCKINGSSTPCDGYCLTCNKYFCTGCYKKHFQAGKIKEHIWLNKSEMPLKKVETNVDSNESVQEICDFHMDAMTEYFCVTCKKVGCVKCMKKNHSRCSGVAFIPIYVRQRNEQRCRNRHLEEDECLSVKKKLAQIKNQLPRHKFGIEKYVSDTRKQMRRFRQSLVEALDTFEDKIESTIEKISEDESKMLDLVLRKCEFYEVNFEKLGSKIRQSKPNGSNNFVLKQKAKEEKEKFENDKVFEHLQELMKITKIRFKPEVRFNKNGKVELGDVVEVRELKQYEKAWTDDGYINTLTEDENKCSTVVSFSACIVLQNGQLLVADQINHVLRLCKTGINVKNETTVILNVVELEKSCADIAQVSKELIVATIPELTRIQKVVHDGKEKIRLDEYITVDKECFGISSDGINLVVGYSSRVDITDLNGNVLHSVTGDESLGFLFDSPNSITCDADRKIVYIADKRKKAIVAMEFNGSIKAVFRGDDMPIPLAVTMGSDGSVLLAADWPYSVQRISPDFVSKEILKEKEDTWDVQCVAYSPVEERLFFSVSGSPQIRARDIGIRAPRDYIMS